MKYKLYKQSDNLDPIHHVLEGRGIQEVDKWLAASWDCVNHWSALGEKKMRAAVDMVEDLIFNNTDIMVVVDADSDGFNSAAIFINYVYKINPEYAVEHIDYFLHSGKQHGLEDFFALKKDELNKYAAVVVPDAASNDFEEQKALSNMGIKVLILDHHECSEEKEYENVIVINNQMCDYPNKSFCGGGVVWQFCRAYDEIKGYEFANSFLDLCAVANLGDMMDYRSLETRAIIQKGLKRFHNPFLKFMMERNKFSMDKMGGINYLSCAFYIVPFINAAVRSGTMKEKKIIFESFLEMKAYELVESEKRGSKGEHVPCVEEAVRICANVKSRQTKLQDEGMALLESRIKEYDMLKNSVLLFTCEPGQIEKNIAGLVANKMMEKYQRPCFVLTKSKNKNDKEYFYRGSARDYSLNEIEDLRQECEDTGLVEFAQGHAAAYGLSIPEKNITAFVKHFNNKYSADSKPTYWIDYLWSPKEVDPNVILAIAGMQDCWGQEIKEANIMIQDLSLGENTVNLLSPNKNPTLKITTPSGVDIMKFKSSQEEYEKFTKANIYLTLVGRCNKNEWNGKISPQIIIKDFELEEKWVF